jgi:hypothetical protein
LIRRRGENISDSQVVFCNVLAGGLPRDLLRYSRQLIEIGGSGVARMSLAEARIRLVQAEVAAKLEASILDAQGRGRAADFEAIVGDLERVKRSWRGLDETTLLKRLDKACRNGRDVAGGARKRGAVRADGKDAITGGASHEDATVSYSSWDDPASTEARVVAYLVFLRLVERAFADTGPMKRLTDAGPCRFDELPADAIEVYEELRRTREQLARGRTASRLHLADAVAALKGGGCTVVKPRKASSKSA